MSRKIQSVLETYIMDITEQEKSRYSYAYEQQIMDYIRKGQAEAFEGGYMTKDIQKAIDNIGKMADKPLKNTEYMVCSAITLSTRAAIQGGLDTSVAYSLSDIYLQRLARYCNNIEKMLEISVEAMSDFAQKVRQEQKQRSGNIYIEKCKSYCLRHLNKTFTLDELAEEININKSYLSKRFKEEEGIGIFAYVQERRIEAAQNMLKYSDQKISNIALYLCFQTQSHFGKIFKEHTGMTPKQYRAVNRVPDFFF